MPNETKTAATKTKATKIHDPMLTLQRAVAYIVLFVLCFVCLFFFYVLIVNATHNNFTIQQGFDPLPRTSFGTNFYNTTHDANVPILSGLRNSLIVSAACAALSVYFSALTAYAIYAYDFKLRKLAFTVILLIMTMPTQVSALGFLNLMDKMKLTNTLWPLILPSIAAPTVFFFMKQYMDSSLPRDIIDAARIDGSGEFHTFNAVILPILKPAMAVQAIFSLEQLLYPGADHQRRQVEDGAHPGCTAAQRGLPQVRYGQGVHDDHHCNLAGYDRLPASLEIYRARGCIGQR